MTAALLRMTSRPAQDDSRFAQDDGVKPNNVILNEVKNPPLNLCIPYHSTTFPWSR